MRVGVSVTLALRFLGIGSARSVSNARKSLYGAVIGIGISLVPLVTVLVVADGMIEGISSRIIELSTSHIRLFDRLDRTGSFGDAQSIERFADSVVSGDLTGKVTDAVPERQGLALAIGKNGRSGATVRAVPQKFFAQNGAVASLLTTQAGSLTFDGPNSAIVGKKLAGDLGLGVGDVFRVLTLKSSADGSTIPRFTTLRVAGIVSAGYQELDALWIFIPLEKGFSVLPDSSATFVSVRLSDATSGLDASKYALMRAFPGVVVYTWKDLNQAQFQSFNTTRTLLLFIMLLIVFIASVNVSAALVMLVMERRQEIAILKSMGAAPETVSLSFLIAGFLTGLGGVLLGLPAGIAVSLHINQFFSLIEKILNGWVKITRVFLDSSDKSAILSIHLLDPAYYLEKIPVRLDLRELLVITVGTLILSLLVSVAPAIRAGREKPLESIRKL